MRVMESEQEPKVKKKPGRKSIPGTERYNVVLDKAVADWALTKPEGLSGMLRRLMAQEKAAEEAQANK